MTNIDKIRAEVEGIREEHRKERDATSRFCSADGFDWPCPTLRLAEDKLRLAEALEALLRAEWMVTHDWGGDRDSVFTLAEHALEKVSK